MIDSVLARLFEQGETALTRRFAARLQAVVRLYGHGGTDVSPFCTTPAWQTLLGRLLAEQHSCRTGRSNFSVGVFRRPTWG